MDFSGAEGPGPGAYSPHVKPQTIIEHAHLAMEDKTQYDAKIPRYHERIVIDESKKVRDVKKSQGSVEVYTL